ncbi:N-acetyltransferase [Methylobacterium sp. WL69]|uniref:GNAT family N-acetyltransferase n=1 Tax=Methylobacterium sp. WL69 TaxID=2603893 RepID=UPI0011C88171|nr:N-acetyltransferase [Methylobacterium sp. WL69]TXM73135.1 N-acetyltransferase [Methylobacterium sp. WL69]
MVLRPENPSDAVAIRALVSAAFRDAPHASGTEADIVDALREDGALSMSLVCTLADEIVGHVAFSPVVVGATAEGWFGLGPVAVQREYRGQGIGLRLIEAGLSSLREHDAVGCVVLGDPHYYRRFGFLADPAVSLAGVPPEFFQCLRLRGNHSQGEVRYHRAFGVA